MANLQGIIGNLSGSINNFITDMPIMMDNIKQGIGNFAKSPQGLQMATTAANTISGLLPEKTEYSGDYGHITQGIDAGYDAAMGAVAEIPGFGPAASAIMAGNKLLGNVANNIGFGTDGMTKTDSILGSSIFATNLGLVNGAFGKRSDTLKNGVNEQDTLAKIGSDYGGSVQQFNNAQHLSNKKYGLLSSGARKKANSQIRESNRQMQQMSGIRATSDEQLATAGNMTNFNTFNYQNTINGGYDPRSYLGRNGLKIDLINHTREILKNRDIKKHSIGGQLKESYFIPIDWQPSGQYVINNIDKYQKGGAFNVLPTGALHARLHHMDDADEITKKGIPVVDMNGRQQAEIERDEIIFRREVTDRIEALAKDGSDEAAIECGKLLTKEIIENTKDNSNLIPKSFRQGGILSAKNGTNLFDQPEWMQPLENGRYGVFYNPFDFKYTVKNPNENTLQDAISQAQPSLVQDPNFGRAVQTTQTPNIQDATSQALKLTDPVQAANNVDAGQLFTDGMQQQKQQQQQQEQQQKEEQERKETQKQQVLGVAKAIGEGFTKGMKVSKERQEANQKLRKQQDDAFYKALGGMNKNAQGFSNLYNQTSLFQNGGTLTDDEKYEIYRNSLPANLANSDPKVYRLRRFWELNGKPPVFAPYPDENGDLLYTFNNNDKLWHTGSVAYNNDTDEYEFLKNSNHPTIKGEIDWYNSKDGSRFRRDWQLITTDDNGNQLDFYKYTRRK